MLCYNAGVLDIILNPWVVDGIIAVAVVLLLWLNRRDGFIKSASSLLAYCVSFAAALALYVPLSNPLIGYGFGRSMVMPAVFLVLWVIVESSLSRLAKRYIADKFPRSVHGHPVNLAFGYPTVVADALIMVAMVLTAVGSAPLMPDERQALMDSKIGGNLVRLAITADRAVSSALGNGGSLTVYAPEDDRVRSVRSLGFSTTQHERNPEAEEELLRLANAARAAEGLNPLVADEALRASAQIHSADMLARGYFSHYSLDGVDAAERAEAAGVIFLAVGENLALAADAPSAHRGLMNSPAHRANILSPQFGRAGFAVEDAGRQGMMVVQVFAD
jgi:uncharacterized protein YkwD